MDIKEESLKCHYNWHGKIEIKSRVDVSDKDKLSLAYTPGVASSCMEIKNNPSKSYELTRRWNTVVVITDGSAILGLGNIGPSAGMPVMEGKCALFKEFGDVDAYPMCINTLDTEEIISHIKAFSLSWGGINLEDISAPRCFEIERRLKEELDIPVFHDDQHGTAIVVGAALINALKLANKKIEDIKIVINGAGAAGIAICKFLLELGVKNIIVCDKMGIINEKEEWLNPAQREISKMTNKDNLRGTLKDAFLKSDVFIGVSGPNCVSEEMVRTMNEKAIVFTLANPTPEIDPNKAKKAGAYIVATGSSLYPNQINNVLVFPGLFRGLLDAKSKIVDFDIMKAATMAIATYIKDDDLQVDHILPYAFDKAAHKRVSEFVKREAIKKGQVRK